MARILSPFLVSVLMSVPLFFVEAKIILSPPEQNCLEQTGTWFEGNKELTDARYSYATSMVTEMTSSLTMTANYPEDKLREYEKVCRDYGGVLHTIKIDFFDCKLSNLDKDVELTLRNFANCLANVEACESFNQENLLEEAWDELGLHCELENVEPGFEGTDDKPLVMDDDLAHKEEKAAAEGADDFDRAEKNAEYIPKEQQGKTKKSGGSRFFTVILTAGIMGGVVYFVYVRKFKSRRLPWGGVTTSRFQSREVGGQNGFLSDYHMLSADDEVNFMGGGHELQLSSTYNP
jgi:hypothetical protein